MFQGAKVLGNESSWERKFPGAKVPGSESSRERKFQGAKVPGSEIVPPMVLSLLGAKVRGNESSSYHSEQFAFAYDGTPVSGCDGPDGRKRRASVPQILNVR